MPATMVELARWQPVLALGALALILLTERPWTAGRRWRVIVINLLLFAASTVVVSALWPVVGGAIQRRFAGGLDWSWVTPVVFGVVVVASILLLDFLQYVVHRLLHASPWLWWLHRVHHSDQVVDGSTGLRHHPLEHIANASAQFIALTLLGVPPVASAVYGIVVSIHNVVAHSDVWLPPDCDALLRVVLITPAMHRVHHSSRYEEGNSNFGVLFPYWDRIFRTYRSETAADVTYGLVASAPAPRLVRTSV